MKHKIVQSKNGLVVMAAVLFALSFTTFNLRAQSLPGKDLYVVPILQTDTGIVLSGARLVTDMKRYDDHPSFSMTGDYLYYTCEGDDYKTDIYAVYMPQYQNVEFISTASFSESMPLQKPDMSGLALIRESSIGHRQVWFYGTDGLDKCLTPNQSNISIYIWLSDTALALRLGDKENVLVVFNIKTNKLDTVAKNIGVSIGKVPSEAAVYYTLIDQGLERLHRYHYDTHKADAMLYLPGGCTEFTVAVDGSLWAANQGIVYRWPRASERWDLIHHFGQAYLGTGHRLAISRDLKWMAMVTNSTY